MRIAVLIPCRNEEKTIAGVVGAFREALPDARCCVYDNGSTDGTANAADAAGAEVRHEPAAGKGNVVRRMFADVEADVYVLVDGDGTYEAAAAPAMVERLASRNLDMVVGARVADGPNPYRRWHRFGNTLSTWLINTQFGAGFTDCLSGYRVMSRRLVKSFPAMSQHFEIEPELTAHCAYLRLPWEETATRYVERPAGSVSKLRTLRDGAHVLLAIALMVKEYRPLRFFSVTSALFGLLAAVLGIPVLAEYSETGLVRRFPTATLCMGLGLAGLGCLLSGVVLDSVHRGRRELKRLAYLRHPSIAEARLGAGEGRPGDRRPAPAAVTRARPRDTGDREETAPRQRPS